MGIVSFAISSLATSAPTSNGHLLSIDQYILLKIASNQRKTAQYCTHFVHFTLVEDPSEVFYSLGDLAQHQPPAVVTLDERQRRADELLGDNRAWLTGGRGSADSRRRGDMRA